MKKNVYTKEFKIGAARMVVEEKVLPSKVAIDLGVSVSALSKWVQTLATLIPSSPLRALPCDERSSYEVFKDLMLNPNRIEPRRSKSLCN